MEQQAFPLLLRSASAVVLLKQFDDQLVSMRKTSSMSKRKIRDSDLELIVRYLREGTRLHHLSAKCLIPNAFLQPLRDALFREAAGGQVQATKLEEAEYIIKAGKA